MRFSNRLIRPRFLLPKDAFLGERLFYMTWGELIDIVILAFIYGFIPVLCGEMIGYLIGNFIAGLFLGLLFMIVFILVKVYVFRGQ